MTLRRTLLAPLMLLLLAQSGPSQTPLTTHSLGRNVYWVEGGGGNSGVIVGKGGVVVIDAKISAAAGKELLARIAKLTPKAVNDVILTHSDRDHVNGLAAFPPGIAVIAQKNNKEEQEQALDEGGKNAPDRAHLPTRVVTKPHESMKLDSVLFELYHWAPAHTSGDLVVYLPKQKIVFTGDIITNRPDPLIHLEKHGSSEGWIKTAQGLVALDADTFIPGHGQPETKADVQKYLAHAEAKREKIKQLVAQGKSLEEVKEAVGDSPEPSGTGPAFPTFTEVVYRELTHK